MARQERLSWWVGLSRDELRRAIAEREALWRTQNRKGFLDHIGELIVGYREPIYRMGRREPRD